MAERNNPSNRRRSQRSRRPGGGEPESSPDAEESPDTVRRIAREPAVDREEVAAREAGIYDEDDGPEPQAEPRRPRNRRGRKRRPPRQEPVEFVPPEEEDVGEEPEDDPEFGWWDEIEEEVGEARELEEEEADGEDEFHPAPAPADRGPARPEKPAREEPAEEEPDGFALGIFPEEEEEEPEPEPLPRPEPEREPEADVEVAPGPVEQEPPAPADEPAQAAERDEGEDLLPGGPGVSSRWMRQVWAEAVGRQPERRERFATSSGDELAPLYGPSTRAAEAFEERVGYPGEFPFTRGVQATMYRGRLWTMRQYAGFASARATNERFRYLLEQGQTGLSVAFDLPTQIGYDSDDEKSAGEVGKVGVPINSLRDMELLLEGIPLDEVSLSMTINSTALILVLMVAAVAKKQGVPVESIRGTVQNDMLKEFVARNTYRFSLNTHLQLVDDLFQFSGEHMPRFHMISISGYHMREAGCTAAQEVAFTLANGIAYVERAVAAGLQVDDFAGRLSFFFAAHNHLFEEVAKFRAARRIWARIMRDRFGAKSPKSMALRFHTQTAGSTLTADQPRTNTVRVALQALAAVLGGTQSLHTNSWDEALGLPTQASALLALRTQQVIAHESGVTDVVDPLGGSPLVEDLTDRIEARVNDYLAKIEGMGGAVEAVRSGWMKGEIEAAAYEAQRDVESGRRVLVGVNQYRIEDEAEPEVLTVDAEQVNQVLADLAALKDERDGKKAEAALAALEISAAWGDADLPELILRCVESYCTVGEICRSLETVLGSGE